MKFLLFFFSLLMFEPEYDNMNVEVKFLGWSKDSNEFAYLVTKEYFKNGHSIDKKTYYYIKEIIDKGKLRNKVLEAKMILPYLKEKGFVKYTLKRKQESDLVFKFRLDKSRYLKFEILVKDILYYRLSYFSGVKSVLIKEGKFDDIYTSFDPKIYVSPNGTYAVCVVKAKTPYSEKDFLFYFRLY